MQYNFGLFLLSWENLRILLPFYYSNFLVYGGAGSRKTKSIGKWLLEEYIKLGFAGFIYDFKDTDYTQTAYNQTRTNEKLFISTQENFFRGVNLDWQLRVNYVGVSDKARRTSINDCIWYQVA